MSIKKALDLINEKYSHLLPNPTLVDAVIADDSMFENQRRFHNSVVLDEGAANALSSALLCIMN